MLRPGLYSCVQAPEREKRQSPKGEGTRGMQGRQEGRLLTLEEHGLAEVTPHVIATHGLDPEQVKAVR